MGKEKSLEEEWNYPDDSKNILGYLEESWWNLMSIKHSSEKNFYLNWWENFDNNNNNSNNNDTRMYVVDTFGRTEICNKVTSGINDLYIYIYIWYSQEG